MRRVLLTRAAFRAEAGAAVRDERVDANRLRRMDRFGRSGVLAGASVLAAAGRAPVAGEAGPDPRFGIVVGTACGCRDAITQHERLLASAGRVEDLAPSVFVATVHNAVCGELAILYGLGGVAETLVSGRTAGLEALALAARRVEAGDADRILVVAAEGLDDETRRAFLRENPGRRLVESAAAVLVQAAEGEREEEDSSSQRRNGSALFIEASLSFDAAALSDVSEEGYSSEGANKAGAEAPGGAGVGGAAIERLGVTGLWEIATDVAAAAAATDAPRRASAAGTPQAHSPSRKIHRYEAQDVHGSRAAVTLAFFS
ncbi:MAG TPA: beta-ketoacyl synthase N-terminal-like domain-containing protein [Thermoanaerobaculia bacterium]|nr:beta-ketoacyl synthase N-terminal-like domain-containing protein [Thermoanaerobaculia bacterium]